MARLQAREVERHRPREGRAHGRRRRRPDVARHLRADRLREGGRRVEGQRPRVATRSSRSPTASKPPAKNGITAVAQPGGSVKDADVIAAADRARPRDGLHRRPPLPSLDSRAIARIRVRPLIWPNASPAVASVAHGRNERDLHGVRAGLRGAVPLPDGGARQRVLLLLLAGLSRQEPARRDDERRRLRLLQQALHRRARLAGRADQGRGALRLLRGVPRAAPRRGRRAPPRQRDGAAALVAAPSPRRRATCAPRRRAPPRRLAPCRAGRPRHRPAPVRAFAHAARSRRRAATPRTVARDASARVRTIAGPRRIAIFNHKGGTGKTTTSVSVAAGLALKGYKVLLVDTDSQGNVGVSLGVKAERRSTTCSSWA